MNTSKREYRKRDNALTRVWSVRVTDEDWQVLEDYRIMANLTRGEVLARLAKKIRAQQDKMADNGNVINRLTNKPFDWGA